jgi:hypothetical protein
MHEIRIDWQIDWQSKIHQWNLYSPMDSKIVGEWHRVWVRIHEFGLTDRNTNTWKFISEFRSFKKISKILEITDKLTKEFKNICWWVHRCFAEMVNHWWTHQHNILLVNLNPNMSDNPKLFPISLPLFPLPLSSTNGRGSLSRIYFR